MKKIYLTLLIFWSLFSCFNIFGYELSKDSKIYVGGQSIGIKLNNGVTVVGTYGVLKDGNIIKPWETSGITDGDKIISLNNFKIVDIKGLLKALNTTNGKQVEIKYIRNNEENISNITPVNVDNGYSLGLYVKDSIMGVGTMTYYIDEIKTYGSLGHQITEDEFYSGEIYEAKVDQIIKPTRKEPGEKKATIISESIGNVTSNSITGVQGIVNDDFDKTSMTLLNFKTKEEIKLGKAYIWTCVSGSEIEKYEIEITKLENQKSKDIKGISFTVTDPKLLEISGGIVQGMSGSPIVQDNKIIGAVTHVLLNNSKKGYGIYLEFMLEDMGIFIAE